MIAFSEIGIDNLLQDLDGKYFTVKIKATPENNLIPEMLQWNTNKKWYYETEDGIVLSEDWLLKLGFKRVQISLEDPIWYEKKEVSVFIEEGVFNYYFNYYFHIELKYVHTLQNLYFALKQEELEIQMD